MNTPIVDKAVVDKAIVGGAMDYVEITSYRGIDVLTGATVSVGKPIAITTPKFDIEAGLLYTLQWKCCMKTPHTTFDYILVGRQRLSAVSVLES